MKQSIGIVVISALVLGIWGYQTHTKPIETNTEPAETSTSTMASEATRDAFVMYKSPLCGCCEGHAQALRKEGYEVDIRPTQDMQAIKSEYGIPLNGQSCHTSIVGEYVVEGHVPLEAIEQLLADQPDIAGIGLAGMPAGTPGMPGEKIQTYEIYQLSHTGETSPYLSI